MSMMQALTTKVKRFACDRCHAQKLRCPRSAAGSPAEEPCVRCKKVGLVCSVSAAQKVGRPRRVSKLCQRTKSPSGNALPPSNEPTQDTSTASLRDYGAISAEPESRDDTELYRSTAKAPTSLASAQSLTSPSNGPFGDSDNQPVVDDFLDYFDFDTGFLETTNPHSTDQKSGPPSPLKLTPEWNKSKQPTLPQTTTTDEHPLSFWRDPVSQTETSEQQSRFNDQSLDNLPTSWNTRSLDIDPTPSTPFLGSWTPAEEVIPRGTMQMGRRSQATMSAQRNKALDNSSHIEMDSGDKRWPTASASFPFSLAAQNPTGTAKKPQQRRANQSRQQPSRPATKAKAPARTIDIEEEEEGSRGEDTERTESLVQLQREILSCTSHLLHRSSIRATTAPRSSLSQHPHNEQSQIKALGKLFGATEKFISLINSPSTMTGKSRSEPTTPSPEILDSSSLPIYSEESMEAMPTTYAVNGKKRRRLSQSASPCERETCSPQQNFSSTSHFDAGEGNFDNAGEEASNLAIADPPTPSSFHRNCYTHPPLTRSPTPISKPNQLQPPFSLTLQSDTQTFPSSPLLKAYASLIDTLSNQLLHITTTAYNNSSSSSSLSSSSAAVMNTDNNAKSLASCLQLQVLALQVEGMGRAVRGAASYRAGGRGWGGRGDREK